MAQNLRLACVGDAASCDVRAGTGLAPERSESQLCKSPGARPVPGVPGGSGRRGSRGARSRSGRAPPKEGLQAVVRTSPVRLSALHTRSRMVGCAKAPRSRTVSAVRTTQAATGKWQRRRRVTSPTQSSKPGQSAVSAILRAGQPVFGSWTSSSRQLQERCMRRFNHDP